MMAKVFFLGVESSERLGHCLFSSEYWKASIKEERGEGVIPFRPLVFDGIFPRDYEQSVARVTYIGGWTVLSMSDRSGDARSGSSSTFFVEGMHNFPETLEHAARVFPKTVTRIHERAPIKLRGT
jgi:hypothetical protein